MNIGHDHELEEEQFPCDLAIKTDEVTGPMKRPAPHGLHQILATLKPLRP
jgi:hypothetical protein